MKPKPIERRGATHRRLTKAQILLGLILGALCSGCTTSLSHLLYGNGVYQGVRQDCAAIASGNPFPIVDLPLSAAADTLLLPYDLTMAPPNPLGKDWSIKENGAATISRTIVDDYEDFTRKQKIEPKWTLIYEDKSGRHAVQLVVETDSADINYTLIYDMNDVRTKVVRWRQLRFHI